MAIKTTSLRIDEELLTKIKILAIEKKVTQQELINQFLKDGLEREDEI